MSETWINKTTWALNIRAERDKLMNENIVLREELAKCRSASCVVLEKPIEAAKEIARMKDNLKFCENWDCPFANDAGIAGLKFCFLNECVRKMDDDEL